MAPLIMLGNALWRVTLWLSLSAAEKILRALVVHLFPPPPRVFGEA